MGEAELGVETAPWPPPVPPRFCGPEPRSWAPDSSPSSRAASRLGGPAAPPIPAARGSKRWKSPAHPGRTSLDKPRCRLTLAACHQPVERRWN